MRTPPSLPTALLLLAISAAAQSPQKPDAATAAWWAQTAALSDDSMEGRDTGSEAYERAAKYVADQFKAAGLKPAGDNGTFFQRVPMHQIDLDVEHSSITVSGPNPPGGYPAGSAFSTPLRLLSETTPIDWGAAAKFNRFYTALTLAIANAPTRPQWLPSSPYSPHQRMSQ